MAAVAGTVGTAGCLGYEVVDDDTVEQLRTERTRLQGRVAAQQVRIGELEAEVERSRNAVQAADAERTRLADRIDRLTERLGGPRVNAVHPVTAWDRLGDVVHRQTDVVAGPEAVIAVNYTYPVHAASGDLGRAAVTERLGLVDEDGDRVRETTNRFRLFIDADQRLAESPFRLDVTDLSAGEYTATVSIRDDDTGIESRPRAATFQLE